MTASLLGAIHGMEWLGPLASTVQDAAYLQAIGTRLAGFQSASGPDTQQQVLFDGSIPKNVSRVRTRDISHFRYNAFSTRHLPRELPDGRRIEGCKSFDTPASGRASVRRLRLRMEDGQTLVLDKTTRSSAEDAGSVTEEGNPPAADDHHIARDIADRWTQDTVKVTLRVSNLHRSLRFYRDVLDLHIERVTSESANFANGLTLTETSRNGKHDWTHLESRDVLIIIRIQDFSHMVSRLRSSNLAEIVGDDGRNDHRQLRVRDPDGHDLKLLAG